MLGNALTMVCPHVSNIWSIPRDTMHNRKQLVMTAVKFKNSKQIYQAPIDGVLDDFLRRRFSDNQRPL